MSDDSNSSAVSVIIPTLNEEHTIGRLLDALLSGSRIPDEIVVGDGGSTDKTREIAERYAEHGVRVVDGPGGISENRNAAIRAASHDIVACTDAGCVPDADWLERLIAPFDRGARWVAGLSRPERSTLIQSVIGLAMMPTPEEVDFAHFVPGGASQAFQKSAWAEVGGFPEGMTAGEDTVFGSRLRHIGIEPVIVTDAQVVWQAPGSTREMMSKAFSWGRADGAAGTNTNSYARIFLVWCGGGSLALLLFLLRFPRAAASVLLGMVGASAWKTRRKHRALDSAVGSIALPFVHAARVTAQGFGWSLGYLQRDDREPLPELVREVGVRGLALAKRRAKSLLGSMGLRDSRAQTGRPSGRVNIDLLLPQGRNPDDWLAVLPDTFRVGIEPTAMTPTDRVATIRPSSVDRSMARRMTSALHDGRAAVVLVRDVNPSSRSSIELRFEALAVAVDPDAIELPDHLDAAAVHRLVTQAGLRHAVLLGGQEATSTSHPIDGVGAALIMGTVPMHDVGGGSRGAQLAHELIARGYHVTYLSLFESNEAVDLGLRYVHPQLEEVRASEFDFARYRDRLSIIDRLAIIELPHPAYLELTKDAQSEQFKVVYDLMDDWSDPMLGGWGYDRAVENAIAATCDAMVASAPSLVERLGDLSGRQVHLVPNAVNVRLFDPAVEHSRPEDIPDDAGPVIEYHGSLYGSWFDWTALESAAQTHSEACFIIIGDETSHPPMPANVRFLGLKPQHLLPAYLAHSDAAIIPFKVSKTTHAVSPLKVFEYLAMGVPVASVPLEPLVDLPGVYTDPALERAIGMALNAQKPDPESVALLHGWGQRLSAIFESAGMELATDPRATPIRISQTHVVHWTPAQRRI